MGKLYHQSSGCPIDAGYRSEYDETTGNFADRRSGADDVVGEKKRTAEVIFKKMCYVDNIAKDDTSGIFLSLRRNNLRGG